MSWEHTQLAIKRACPFVPEVATEQPFTYSLLRTLSIPALSWVLERPYSKCRPPGRSFTRFYGGLAMSLTRNVFLNGTQACSKSHGGPRPGLCSGLRIQCVLYCNMLSVGPQIPLPLSNSRDLGAAVTEFSYCFHVSNHCNSVTFIKRPLAESSVLGQVV